MIILVRHGQTFDNVKHVFQNKYSELTANGTKDAVVSGEELLKYDIFDIISSPYHRTLQTAHIIKKQYNWNKAIKVWDRLKERNVGCYEQLPISEVIKKIDFYDESFHPENGENIKNFNCRVDNIWNEIVEYAEKKDIFKHNKALVIVTHGLVIHRILQHFFKCKIGRFDIKNGSLSIIKKNESDELYIDIKTK